MDLPLNIDIFQILLHMLNLVILTGGLSLILYKPAVKFLDERRRRFEELEEKRLKTESEYEALSARRDELIASAEKEAAEIKAGAEKEITEMTKRYVDEAKQKSDAIIKAAEEEAEMRKKTILESAQTEIGELVLSATQKLLNDSADSKTDSALYDEFIRTASSAQNDGKKKK